MVKYCNINKIVAFDTEPRLTRRLRGGRRNHANNRVNRRINNHRRKFDERMCELAAEVDNSDNEENEEVAAAECIEDIPDIAGFRMTRDEIVQGRTDADGLMCQNMILSHFAHG